MSRFSLPRVNHIKARFLMELFSVFREASIAALLSMLVTLFPAVAGGAYLLSPSERRLAFMRPISLAGLFAGLAGLLLGFINVLRGIWIAESAVNWSNVAVGSAEA